MNTMARPAAQLSDSEGRQWEQLDLPHIFSIIWRSKFILSGAMLLGAIAAVYLTIRYVEPTYSATSVIEFSQDTGPAPTITSFVAGSSLDRVSLNTQLASLRTFETAEKLTNRLDLTRFPEFNPNLRTPSLWAQFKGTAIRRIKGITPQELPPEQQRARELRRTISNVQRRISVSGARDSWTINMTVHSQSPAVAARLANTLAEIYIEGREERRFEAASSTIAWLAEQVEDLEIDLVTKEEALNALIATTDVVDQGSLGLLSRRVRDFQTELVSAEQALEAAVQAFETAQADIEAGRSEATPSDLRDLERLQFAVDRERQSVATLSRTLDEVTARFDERSKSLEDIVQLEREINSARDLYQTFLTGLQETTIYVGQSQKDAFIMSRALPPLSPDAPNPTVNAVLAMVLIGVALCGFLIWRELVTSVFRTSEELESYTGLPVLGETIAIANKGRRSLVERYISNPTSPQAESLRNLRTSIFMGNSTPPEVIMLTSSVPSEGKTMLSASLAANIAQLQRKVLLVDCDAHRRSLHEVVGANQVRPVLKDFCDGTARLEDAEIFDQTLGLDFVANQIGDISPADFFTSAGFEQFIATARQLYDHIIIDTPPVLVVADARVISAQVDAILYVVRWDKTTRAQTARGLAQLTSVGTSVTGLVLSQISAKGMRRYGESYGSYATYGKSY